VTLLAYRFALDPTPAQDRLLRSHCGAVRMAFNTGLDGLARALKNWGDSRSGRRKGAPAGFPRFKSKHCSRLSVRSSLQRPPSRSTSTTRGRRPHRR